METARTSSAARKGFTLVELLVVVVIIGMLVGLTIPAVLAARSAARRAKCFNQQQELGKAVIHYASTKQSFPGYVNHFQNRQFSWVLMILPHLGREDVWVAWRDGHNPVVLIDQLVCPDDPAAANRDAPLSYVVSLNLCRDRSNPNLSRANAVRMEDVRAPQRTPMLSERLNVGPWTSNDPSLLGFQWPQQGPAANYVASNHAGGFIVTFADGSADFLPEATDCNQYQTGPLSP